ncbi:hypothetical protein D3C74_413260 [compost metagenome]
MGRDVAHITFLFTDPESFHQLPGCVIGGADVPNFAGSDHIVQRAECLIQRCMRIKGVDLIQIHIIGLQTLQAMFQLLLQMVAGGTAPMGTVMPGKSGFGRKHRVFPTTCEGLSNDAF